MSVAARRRNPSVGLGIVIGIDGLRPGLWSNQCWRIRRRKRAKGERGGTRHDIAWVSGKSRRVGSRGGLSEPRPRGIMTSSTLQLDLHFTLISCHFDYTTALPRPPTEQIIPQGGFKPLSITIEQPFKRIALLSLVSVPPTTSQSSLSTRDNRNIFSLSLESA